MNRTNIALPLVALLTLSGCTSSSTDPTSESTTTPSGAGSAEPSSPSDFPVPVADDAEVIPVPEAPADSQAAAVAAAEAVVTAFGQPTLPYPEWINGLYPLMTQTGAAAYEDTDPQNVPVHQVTGEPTVLDGSTDVALIVEVPTDAGPYTVSLSRPSAEAPWLADRIRPATR